MKLFRRIIAFTVCAIMLILMSVPSALAQTREDSLFSVESVDIENGILTARVTASDNCTLVAAFFNEEGQTMLCGTSASVELAESVSVDSVEVEIDCTQLNLPTYYILKVYLLDTNLRALCEPFVSKHFTEGFHAFSQKNALDYTNYPHIMLSEDGESFAAINRNALVLESNGNTDIISGAKDASGSYVFSHVSNEVKNLQAGDILYYPYGDEPEETILIKVASVEMGNDSTCVVYSAPASLSDLFDCIKIDIDLEAEIDTTAALEQGITYNGVGVDGAFVYNIAGRWLASEVNGNVRLSAGAHFTMYFDAELLGTDYFEVSFTANLNSEADVALSRKLDKTVELLPITLSAPLPGITASVTPSLTLSADGKCSVIASHNSDMGIVYTQSFGYSEIVSVPQTELLSFACEKDTEFSLGLNAEYGLNMLKNCKITSSASQVCDFTAQMSQASEEHECKSCISIKATDSLSNAVEMKIGRNKASGIISGEASAKNVESDTYYVSSEHGLGKGACPSAPEITPEVPIGLPVHSYDGEKALAEYTPLNGAVSLNRCAPLSEFTVILIKDVHALQLLGADNIAYIGKAMSGTDGLLTFNYSSAVQADAYNVLVCGDINENNTCAHVPGAWSSSIVPPCLLVGIDAVNCVKCSSLMSERLVPGKSHDWGEWDIISEATIESDGEKVHVCKLCGQSETVIIDKLVRYEYPLGDVDGDFTVSASDARLALRCAVNLTTLTGAAFECADVDENDEISSSDARLILRIAVKLDNNTRMITALK